MSNPYNPNDPRLQVTRRHLLANASRSFGAAAHIISQWPADAIKVTTKKALPKVRSLAADDKKGEKYYEAAVAIARRLKYAR